MHSTDRFSLGPAVAIQSCDLFCTTVSGCAYDRPAHPRLSMPALKFNGFWIIHRVVLL